MRYRLGFILSGVRPACVLSAAARRCGGGATLLSPPGATALRSMPGGAGAWTSKRLLEVPGLLLGQVPRLVPVLRRIGVLPADDRDVLVVQSEALRFVARYSREGSTNLVAVVVQGGSALRFPS